SMTDLLNLEKLESLDVSGTSLNIAGLREAAKFKSLEHLEVEKNKMTDELISALNGAGKLHVLSICTGKKGAKAASDDDVEVLDLTGTWVKREGLSRMDLKKVKRVMVPPLKVVKIDADLIETLERFGKLQDIEISPPTTLTLDAMHRLADNSKIKTVEF